MSQQPTKEPISLEDRVLHKVDEITTPDRKQSTVADKNGQSESIVIKARHRPNPWILFAGAVALIVLLISGSISISLPGMKHRARERAAMTHQLAPGP